VFDRHPRATLILGHMGEFLPFMRSRPGSRYPPSTWKLRHADELAQLVSRENGKPVADARLHDVGFLVGIFRFFGSLADKLPSEFYDKGSIYTSTVLEPLGVSARSSRSTGRPSTPTARSRQRWPSGTPSCSSRARQRR
jgi:hypothetical protein